MISLPSLALLPRRPPPARSRARLRSNSPTQGELLVGLLFWSLELDGRGSKVGRLNRISATVVVVAEDGDVPAAPGMVCLHFKVLPLAAVTKLQ